MCQNREGGVRVRVCWYVDTVPRRSSVGVSTHFKCYQSRFETCYSRTYGMWVGSNDGKVFHVNIQSIAKQFHIDNLRKMGRSGGVRGRRGEGLSEGDLRK